MSKLKVTMTESKYGADDGVTVLLYERGETYELGKDLSQAFLAEKWAKPAKTAATTPAKPE